MKNRITVRHGLLTDLANWLIENGWTIQEPKGEYEVLRACKQGYVRPLLIYDRDKGCGYSIDERDEKSLPEMAKRQKEKRIISEYDINTGRDPRKLPCYQQPHNQDKAAKSIFRV